MVYNTSVVGECGFNDIPLFPPVIIDDGRRYGEWREERRDDRRGYPGVSVNVITNQTSSGVLQLGGINFSDGSIQVSGSNILIRRGGRYVVDINVLVSYAVAGTNSSFFSVMPNYGAPVAGGTSLTVGDQVYSGSTVVQVGDGGSISISTSLVGSVVLRGTVSVQMVAESDRRREY